jgi:hypothetical protein
MINNNMDVYFIRQKFKDLTDGQQIINQLHKNAEIAIRLEDNDEVISWNDTKDDYLAKVKSRGVKAWRKLENLVKSNDVLIVSQYNNTSTTLIGILKKDSMIIEEKIGKAELKKYKLSEVKYIKENKKYKLFTTLNPSGLTIIPVLKSREIINFIYSGNINNISLETLTNTHVEELCNDWIKKQNENDFHREIFPPGGNTEFLDILIQLKNNTIIAAQVSTSSDKNRVENKCVKLLKVQADKYYMFGNLEGYNNENLNYIMLKKVWGDLTSDSNYLQIINKKLTEFYQSFQNQIQND